MSSRSLSGMVSGSHRLSRSAVGRISRNVGSSQSMKAAGRFLRRQLWAWPIFAALILGLVGWWVSRSVENALRDQRVAELNAIVEANVESLRVWLGEEERIARIIADDEPLQSETRELLKISTAKPNAARELVQSEHQAGVRARLAQKLPKGHYAGFFIVSPDGVVIACDQDAAVGKKLGAYRAEFFSDTLARGAGVSKPFRSPLLLADEKGELRANLPSMFAAAAMGPPKAAIAVLGLRIRPDQEFTQILRTAQFGKTGESYAFDHNGLLLSNSRFDEDLKRIGLLADLPESQSTLTLEMRNPGVNMMSGQRPAQRRAEQPLTRPAQEGSLARDGIDPDGYLDYRGVPCVGAWRWLPEYDFGVVTELDLDEALIPVVLLRRAFWVLMTLLGLAAIGIFIAMLVMARQQKALQAATLAARQLGQYSLEQKLGAGGMGTVYRARHAMLRRPTAVKLLDVEKISEAAIARFEREVQLTSGLTHPNTIAVFDYGRTPEGIFYYAMEYLEGINLDDLVKTHGPLPETRALHLLKQICGSLAEAHDTGLVHRDIKPANVVLTVRGGVHDFVKVLDFGLAKAADGDSANVTSANAITGTPLYLAPEAVNAPDKVDAASDVYAIGAVGYFLVTGSPVFTGSTVMEICMKHVQAKPEPPSARGVAISARFEAILLRCLAKSQSDRPQNAGQLLDELNQCDSAGWTEVQAKAWWMTVASAPNAAQTQDVPKAHSTVETTMAYEPTAN